MGVAPFEGAVGGAVEGVGVVLGAGAVGPVGAGLVHARGGVGLSFFLLLEHLGSGSVRVVFC